MTFSMFLCFIVVQHSSQWNNKVSRSLVFVHIQFVLTWSIVPMSFFSMFLGFIVVQHLLQWKNKVASSLSKTINFLYFASLFACVFVSTQSVSSLYCRKPLWITSQTHCHCIHHNFHTLYMSCHNLVEIRIPKKLLSVSSS